jgi:hypothetical protein
MTHLQIPPSISCDRSSFRDEHNLRHKHFNETDDDTTIRNNPRILTYELPSISSIMNTTIITSTLPLASVSVPVFTGSIESAITTYQPSSVLDWSFAKALWNYFVPFLMKFNALPLPFSIQGRLLCGSRQRDYSIRPKSDRSVKMSSFSFVKAIVLFIWMMSSYGIQSYAQDSSGSCRMEIYVYDDNQVCKGLNPPNGIGYIIPDGKCRTVEIDESIGTSVNDYALFPGTYRAQCTHDGKSVRFADSGCKSTNCTSQTVGADTCSRDLTLPSSLYARNRLPEYPSQSKSVATSSKLFSCSALTDGYKLNVSFIIFGSCTDPQCNRLSSPAPVRPTSPVSTSPTDPPQTSSSSEQPTTTPNSQPSEPSSQPPFTDVTIQPTIPLRNDTARVEMILSDVTNGTMSDNAALDWGTTLKQHVKASALNEGYELNTIYIRRIEEQNLDPDLIITDNSSNATSPPDRLLIEQDVSENTFPHVEDQYLTNEHEYESNGSSPRRFLDKSINNRKLQQTTIDPKILRIEFDFFVVFKINTRQDVTAAEVITNAFNTEQKRTAFVLDLVSIDPDTFKNVNKINITTDELIVKSSPPASSPVAVSDNQGNLDSPTSTISSSGSGSYGLIIGVASGSAIFLIVVGIFLYRRGQKDALSQTKSETPIDGDLSPSSTYISSQQHQQQQQMQQSERWTNEIIIDPSNDDVSTLGGSTLAELNLMRNGRRGVIDEDEHTASVNVDFDFARNRYRTGAIHEDATIDDRSRGAYTNQTNPTMYTALSKYGGPSMFADDDMSFDRQYVDDENELTDDDMHNLQPSYHNTADSFEVINEGGILTASNGMSKKKFVDGLKISPNVSMQNHASATSNSSSPPAGLGSPTDSTGTWLTKPFEIRVPPGVLGMVIDTPGGSTPVVRAVKNNSVLVGQVLIGDRLLSVDHIDVTKMPAMQVSNLISTRSHQSRVLLFVRPIPSSVTTATDSPR